MVVNEIREIQATAFVLRCGINAGKRMMRISHMVLTIVGSDNGEIILNL